MSIPVISPVEIVLGEPGIRRLPPPDYEIHALPAAAVLTAGDIQESVQKPLRDPAIEALGEIELAARVSEYHDFAWWEERIRLLRARLEQTRS